MYHTLKFLSVFMITLFLDYSCNRDNSMSDAKQIAEDHNNAKFVDKASRTDAQYLVDAYSAGLVAINLAQRAKDLAVTTEVKNLAETMITAHTNLNADIAVLAARKQISIPDALNNDQTNEITSLCEKRGRDFDVAYTDKMMAAHKDAISLFEKASENATDKDIRDFFNTALPEVRSHLDMTMNVKDALK